MSHFELGIIILFPKCFGCVICPAGEMIRSVLILNTELRIRFDGKMNALAYPRHENQTLSFYGEPLLRGRHLIHPYPAMLHPLLVDFLIGKLAKKGNTIFDPFCGSGVVCLQSSLKKYRSIGFDINPVALLVAKTKTLNYTPSVLEDEFRDLMRGIRNTKKADIPDIKNIDYWYSDEVTNDLGIIRHALKAGQYRYSDFFLSIFAYICRQQSLTRKGEFKRYRINDHESARKKNEVFSLFRSHADKAIKLFCHTDSPREESSINLKNMETPLDSDTNYDLVVTSPPYGDSRTTVAYGQYTSFGIEWTKDINPYCCSRTGYQLDQSSLGKPGELNKELLSHKPLQDTIWRISEVDQKRADEVLHFFNGYYNTIRNTVERLNPKGKVCFVVGNRTVKDVQIPMDQITASFLEDAGLRFRKIVVREISNKVMPSRNSPSNVAGATSKTMTNEYIVLCEKA